MKGSERKVVPDAHLDDPISDLGESEANMGRISDLFSPLSQLRREMRRTLEDVEVPSAEVGAFPAVNVWDEGEHVFVESELPGMKPEDLSISVAGADLMFSGRRTIEEPENQTSHRRERISGSFARSITLPWDIDPEHVEARLTDGVLTVKLPKAESARPKKVKVASA